MLSVQEASHGAGQTRPVTSGKLFVECRLSAAVLPVGVIDEVVPVRDLVVDRAAVVTIGNAAVHAARGLTSRTSGSASGTTNSCQCCTRSSTGLYLRSARSNLEKPGRLAHSCRSCVFRCRARGATCCPHHFME